MLSEFTYTMIGPADGGVLENLVNKELDFHTHTYEVCLLDILFMPGAWNNVRPGANIITYQHDYHGQHDLYVEPGNYVDTYAFISALNSAMDGIAKFHVQGDYHVLTHNVTEMRFCKELAYLLGIIETLSQSIPWIKHGWTIQSTFIDPKRNNLTMLWLFADFVGNTIIGNLQLPLLRYIPIKVGSGILEHSVLSNQHYVRVRRVKRSSLSVTFKTAMLASETLRR